MIIQIDTDKIVDELLDTLGWDSKDFEGGIEVPYGWSNAILEVIPDYEDTIYKECIKRLGDDN